MIEPVPDDALLRRGWKIQRTKKKDKKGEKKLSWVSRNPLVTIQKPGNSGYAIVSNVAYHRVSLSKWFVIPQIIRISYFINSCICLFTNNKQTNNKQKFNNDKFFMLFDKKDWSLSTDLFKFLWKNRQRETTSAEREKKKTILCFSSPPPPC